MKTQTQQRSSSIFDVPQKSVEQIETENAQRLSETRARLAMGRSHTAPQDPAQGLPNAPISVEAWRAILSPEQMARYDFAAYDCLLSLTALQTMQNHDYATEGAFGRERATFDNLREAMTGLYEAGTVDLLLSGSHLSVHLCVPGGGLTHWPVHIPRPAKAASPQPEPAQDEEQDHDDEGLLRLWGAVQDDDDLS